MQASSEDSQAAGVGGVDSEVIHMSAATITSEPLGYNSIAQAWYYKVEELSSIQWLAAQE